MEKHQGVFDKREIVHIQQLITEINQRADIDASKHFLQEQVEDVDLFLEALSAVQKKKVAALRAAVYGRCPSNEKKEEMVSAIREYFHFSDRAIAFRGVK